MTPSQEYKALGGRALVDVHRVAQIPPQTLRDWHRTKPELFRAVCVGVIHILNEA